MTTYTFKLYNSGYGYYEDYYTYEYSEYEFYDVDTVSISVLGDDPDYMTVENGEVTYPDFAWEDHFNWYSTYSQSEIYRFDWYGGTTFMFSLSASYYTYFDGYGYSYEDMWVTVGGDELPDFSDLPEDEQWDAFVGLLNSGTMTSTNGYADGTQIAMEDFAGVVVSENDVIEGTDGDDSTATGIGNDRFEESYGSLGADYLDGGYGIDTVVYGAGYSTARSYVVLDLLDSSKNGGAATGDVIVRVEKATGTTGDDQIWGTNGGNVLRGGDGEDSLYGRVGIDRLLGGRGNDLLDGGAGADELDGGDGRDRATYASASGAVVVDMMVTGNSSGWAAGDTFISIEILEGSDFADTLLGDDLANRIIGGTGNDLIRGRGDNDVLFGQAGDDTLRGDAGDDRMYGGAGEDTFQFNGGHDIVEDFTAGEDLLMISNRFGAGPVISDADLEAVASVVDGSLVLAFGPAHSLTLTGVTSIDTVLDAYMGY